MDDTYSFLLPAIPSDHARQTRGLDIVKARVKAGFSPKTIIDVGCGLGRSRGQLLSFIKDATWLGIDIEESPEVNARPETRDDMLSYDGVNLPVESDSVDLVYSHQVFEHVRYPEKLLRDISRVLTPSGLFIGQTSHLEPYHSRSIFNFTPYGWKLICEANGLEAIELRPSIDGQTLVERTVSGKPPRFSQWFVKESPINRQISRREKAKSTSAQRINFKKLNISGQFCFVCRRKPLKP